MSAPKRIFLNSFSDAIDALARDQEAILSIIGPTGTGKTKLALDIAKHFSQKNTQLVSVDSVALYKDLNIGSAKPMGEEREGYNWIGLDQLEIDDVATSSAFVEAVLPVIKSHLQAQKPVVVVGGSHFYEQALCIGRMPGEASDLDFQSRLEPQKTEVLYARLLKQDPRFAQKINVADRYRITRYLDLTEHQGLTLDELSSPKDSRPWKTIYTISTAKDANLDERTETLRQRVQQMFDQGWIGEVKEILNRGASPQAAGLQTVGYRDIVLHLENKSSFEETFENIVIAHRQLAKVQRTWVRGLAKRAQQE